MLRLFTAISLIGLLATFLKLDGFHTGIHPVAFRKRTTLCFPIKLQIRMESVGGGFSSPPPSTPKSFIISPSSLYAEDEMMILDNFNQIQMGEQKRIGIFGTSRLDENHQQMIELLSYALVLSGNHVFTSGGGNGTNVAVIRGALRACNPDLLTVILPQSLLLQSDDMQQLLSRVSNLIEQPVNNELELKEAAQLCNKKILESVDKVLAFAHHDSYTVLSSVDSVANLMEVTKFYLD